MPTCLEKFLIDRLESNFQPEKEMQNAINETCRKTKNPLETEGRAETSHFVNFNPYSILCISIWYFIPFIFNIIRLLCDALYLIIIEDLSMMVIRSPFAFLAQTTFICTYILYVQYRSQVTCTILWNLAQPTCVIVCDIEQILRDCTRLSFETSHK